MSNSSSYGCLVFKILQMGKLFRGGALDIKGLVLDVKLCRNDKKVLG